MKRSPLHRKTRLKKVGARRAWWMKASVQWSAAVKKRDRRCQWSDRGPCYGVLEANHVWPKGHYPSCRFIVENGLALCSHHHELWHRASTLNREWWRWRFPERAKIVQKVLDSRRVMSEDEVAALSERGRKRRTR